MPKTMRLIDAHPICLELSRSAEPGGKYGAVKEDR